MSGKQHTHQPGALAGGVCLHSALVQLARQLYVLLPLLQHSPCLHHQHPDGSVGSQASKSIKSIGYSELDQVLHMPLASTSAPLAARATLLKLRTGTAAVAASGCA